MLALRGCTICGAWATLPEPACHLRKPVTLGSLEHSGNYIVCDGSLIGDLLEFAHIPLHTGDSVRGGPLRGESVDSLAAA